MWCRHICFLSKTIACSQLVDVSVSDLGVVAINCHSNKHALILFVTWSRSVAIVIDFESDHEASVLFAGRSDAVATTTDCQPVEHIKQV